MSSSFAQVQNAGSFSLSSTEPDPRQRDTSKHGAHDHGIHRQDIQSDQDHCLQSSIPSALQAPSDCHQDTAESFERASHKLHIDVSHRMEFGPNVSRHSESVT